MPQATSPQPRVWFAALKQRNRSAILSYL